MGIGTRIHAGRRDMKHIVMLSGGLGSWMAACRVREKIGDEQLICLFTDTSTEDDDTYRFVEDSAKNVRGELVWLRDGRNIWEVFEDKRMIGNSRIAPCSHVLKQDMSRKYLEANHSPDDTTIYLGIDWSEQHRYDRAKEKWLPWKVEAPLCDKPYLSKDNMIASARYYGMHIPKLYTLGFAHNNCGGFCVRAGQAHFAHLLKTLPETYAHHEKKEREMRNFLKKDVAIMRDRSGGKNVPLTMETFRLRVESQMTFDKDDWGACGCFTSEDTDGTATR